MVSVNLLLLKQDWLVANAFLNLQYNLKLFFLFDVLFYIVNTTSFTLVGVSGIIVQRLSTTTVSNKLLFINIYIYLVSKP